MDLGIIIGISVVTVAFVYYLEEWISNLMLRESLVTFSEYEEY
jgi:hypothetical protein